MKKTITILLILCSTLLILDSFNFGHAMMMFLLAGVVPGTNIIIDADSMLELVAIVSGFIVARVVTAIVRSALAKPSVAQLSQV